MEIEPSGKRQWIVMTFALTVLAGLSVALGLLVRRLAAISEQSQGRTREYYMYMSLTVVALLCVVLLALAWVVIRHLAQRFKGSGQRHKTKYVDAWALAGKRVKPAEEPDQDSDDEDKQDQS